MDTMNTKTLGCTLLIAGTTIGAGMLALPLASSSLGGPATLLLMIGLWALMAFTAMLQVEASLNTGKWYLHQLADHLLGVALFLGLSRHVVLLVVGASA